MEKLTNKRLVKTLMSESGIEMIAIKATAVIVQFKPNFTPAMADSLCKRVGQEAARRESTSKGNFIIFSRF